MVYFPFSSSTPVCDGGENDTTSSGDLFGNYDNDYVVKNGVGEITENTTVGQLKQQNSDLTDIIAKMLAIQPRPVVTPKINPQGSLVITTPAGDVKYNSNFPPEITVRFNRGKWQDALKSDGSPASTLPYNPGDTVVINNAFGFSDTDAAMTTNNVTPERPENVIYKANSSDNGNFEQWTTFVLSASMTTPSTPTGNVYNNYGDITTAPVDITFTAEKKWNVYKPVFLDGVEVINSISSGGTGPASSGQKCTVKVFFNTDTIIFINQQNNQKMKVPFLPTNISKYDNSLTFSWSLYLPDEYTITSIEDPTYGSYYEVTILTQRVSGTKGQADIKITK